MADALHFTGNQEADVLLAQEPLALLIGFALDQQVPVQTAFSGPLKLKQRFGTLDARELATATRANSRRRFERSRRSIASRARWRSACRSSRR